MPDSFYTVRRFSSKIGLSLAGPVLLLLSGVFLLFVYQVHWWVALLFLLPTLLFVAWIFLRTEYLLTDREELVIICGPSRWCIPVSSIRSVEPTRSILAGPALSFDRLRICYNTYDEVLVSPKDKDAFLEALLSLNPSVKVLK